MAEPTKEEIVMSNRIAPAINQLIDEIGKVEYAGNYRIERYNYVQWHLYPKSRRSEEGDLCVVALRRNNDDFRFGGAEFYLFIDFTTNIQRIPPVVSTTSIKNFCERAHQATGLPIIGMRGAQELYYDDKAHRTID